jgi:hypothetical protein
MQHVVKWISDITIFPCYGAQRQERSTKIYGYYSQEFNFQRATIITWTHLKNGELEISKDRHAKVRFVYTERRNKELAICNEGYQISKQNHGDEKCQVTRKHNLASSLNHHTTWPPSVPGDGVAWFQSTVCSSRKLSCHTSLPCNLERNSIN